MKTEFYKIKRTQGDQEAKKWLADEIRKHILDIGKTLDGKVSSWDVINETAANRDFMNILGYGAMAEWFRITREAAPNAKLMFTENSLLAGRKLDHFLKLAKMIKDAGAPIGGLGAQGHIGPMGIPKFLKSLDRLASLGLPVSITEFDVKCVDKKLQGDMFRDALTAFFSHPSVDAVITWGFWDGRHWLSDAPFFYRDWTPKPALKQYEDLVFKKWWTNVKGQTNATGTLSARAFHGRHHIVVTHEGKKQEMDADITPTSNEITLVLE